MSATSVVLESAAGDIAKEVAAVVVGLPVMLLYSLVTGMRLLMGCEATLILLLLTTLYAGYHMFAKDVVTGMLLWASSSSGAVLALFDCGVDLDLAMLLPPIYKK
jgi:hypothetical protein